RGYSARDQLQTSGSGTPGMNLATHEANTRVNLGIGSVINQPQGCRLTLGPLRFSRGRNNQRKIQRLLFYLLISIAGYRLDFSTALGEPLGQVRQIFAARHIDAHIE